MISSGAHPRWSSRKIGTLRRKEYKKLTGTSMRVTEHDTTTYVLATPGDPSTATVTFDGQVFTATAAGTGQVFHDVGTVTFSAGTVPREGGPHDTLDNFPAVVQAACAALS